MIVILHKLLYVKKMQHLQENLHSHEQNIKMGEVWLHHFNKFLLDLGNMVENYITLLNFNISYSKS